MADRTAHGIRGGGKTILWAALLTASVYWVGEAAIHSIVFKHGSIAQQLLPTDSHELWMRSFVFLLFIAFGAFAYVLDARIHRARVEQQRLQTRLEEALTRVLSGFLPICAGCKKIRMDDSGPELDSSWHRVESYLAERTNLELTHSICPACERELYGNHSKERSDTYEI